MTFEELRQYVDQLGVSRGQLSQYLGVDYRTLSRWLSGDTPVPRMLEIIINTQALHIEHVQEVVIKKKIS